MSGRSESIVELTKALAKAQSAFPKLVADQTADIANQKARYSYQYADLASVLDTIRKPLNENGLTVMQFPSSEGCMVSIETLLSHESGEYVTSTLTLKATRDDPQAIGSAMTYGRRYSLLAIVGLAPDDDDDGTAASTPVRQTASKPSSPPQTEKSDQLNVETVVARVRSLPSVSKLNEAGKWITEQWEGKRISDGDYATLKKTVIRRAMAVSEEVVELKAIKNKVVEQTASGVFGDDESGEIIRAIDDKIEVITQAASQNGTYEEPADDDAFFAATN